MGVIVNTVKHLQDGVNQCNSFGIGSSQMASKVRTFSNKGMNAGENFDLATKQSLIGSDSRNVLEGITQGDLNSVVLNAGLLTFVACRMGSAAASSKAMYSFGAVSSGAGMLGLGALGMSQVQNGGNNSQTQATYKDDENIGYGSSFTLNAKSEEKSIDGGKKKKRSATPNKTLKEIKKEKEEELLKKKSQIKPKRPVSAFFFFMQENRPKILEAKGKLSTKEFAQTNSEDWKNCSAEDRKKFEEMNTKDRTRYEGELKQLEELGYFINADGIKSTELDKKGNKKEFPEGTMMPKKVNSAYMYYFIESQQARKKEVGDGKSNVTQVTKDISLKWKNFSDADKDKYVKLHEKDILRHEDQIKSLKDKGFFMTKDGQKSTDLPPPKAKKSKKEKAKLKAQMEKVLAQQKEMKEKTKVKKEKEKAKEMAAKEKEKEKKAAKKEKMLAQKEKSSDKKKVMKVKKRSKSEASKSRKSSKSKSRSKSARPNKKKKTKK